MNDCSDDWVQNKQYYIKKKVYVQRVVLRMKIIKLFIILNVFQNAPIILIYQ